MAQFLCSMVRSLKWHDGFTGFAGASTWRPGGPISRGLPCIV